MTAPRCVALIPAYQAEPWIADVVARTRAVLPDVVVVDDGSTDATSAAAAESGAEVVSHPVNRGKSAALRTGFDLLFARGFDAIVTLDADGQHLPEEIPLLLDALPGADLVLGVRSHLFAEMSALRRASNRISSRLISLVAGIPVVDVQTGFRLYTAALVRVTGFPGERFAAESAVVVRAARQGLRVVAVPIRLGYADGRRSSHYRPIADSTRIGLAVLRARFAEAG